MLICNAHEKYFILFYLYVGATEEFIPVTRWKEKLFNVLFDAVLVELKKVQMKER